MVSQLDRGWVLLSYRMPREPSTPRIAVWRKLRRLGVLQIGDGLVALPADPRTVEQLEWVAEQVVEAEGSAMVWTARPADGRDHDRLVAELRDARTVEYDELRADIEAELTATPGPIGSRAVARWRRRYRAIQRRDHLDAPAADGVFGLINTAADAASNAGATR